MAELSFENTINMLTPKFTKRQMRDRLFEIQSFNLMPDVFFYNNIPCFKVMDYIICEENEIYYIRRPIAADSECDAIIWVCEQLLPKINEYTESFRKYLIGKIALIHTQGTIYSPPGPNWRYRKDMDGKTPYTTACNEIAERFYISYQSVKKYIRYAAALEKIYPMCPEFVDYIFSERIKMSHENIDKLVSSNEETIKKITESLVEDVKTKRDNHILHQSRQYGLDGSKKDEPITKIKTTPEFDPDVQVNSLNYTIPSWQQSIERVTKTDLTIITDAARNRLVLSLNRLITCAKNLKNELEGDTNGF